MRGTKLPVTPEDNVVINYLLPEDSRMSKSMNDIPMATFGNQGRHVADSSDSQSFTDEDSLPTVRSQMSAYRMRNRVTVLLYRGYHIQWNLRITDTLGAWLLSVVESCPFWEILLFIEIQ